MATADRPDSPSASSAPQLERPHPLSAPVSEIAVAHGILDTPSHGIEINFPPATPNNHGDQDEANPQNLLRHMSLPTYSSPLRHHQRTASRTKQVKETLNARSHYGSGDGEDDGRAVHRINQYEIKEEIGRGSFGAVHRAVDQYGMEYAVKEFSKSRLRKRVQSNLLRQGPNGKQRRPGHLAAGVGFNAPLHRVSSEDRKSNGDENNSLNLIKEEIAIMKKLSHHNLVSLHEVLDDPEEDSLYMVMDMCKKGVVMKVGLGSRAEPYDEEVCRCWFRDMILGIEYLHAQGVVHRDIKPDNCLITDDDVLKIVDFGVSEMFEKASDMATAKSAGSPAFMPPELCVAKHGEVSGRAADVWSMGVTLFCLRYGYIPFEKDNMLELYDSIRDDELVLEEEKDKSFEDLIRRLLEKDATKRITIEEMRQHPWITKNGTDPLLSADENCADLVDPPTEIEKNHAITGNMGNLLSIMRAVKRFKRLVARKRPQLMEAIFGSSSRIVEPPHSLQSHNPRMSATSRSADADDRKPMERCLTTEGVHRAMPPSDGKQKLQGGSDHLVKVAESNDHTSQHKDDRERPANTDTTSERPDSNPAAHRTPPRSTSRGRTLPIDDTAKGHAHNPLDDIAFLNIGPGIEAPEAYGDLDHPIVSESPPAVDMNIYEQAYQDEMKRITDSRGEEPAIYLNRRIEHRDDLKKSAMILDRPVAAAGKIADKMGLTGSSGGGFAKLIRQAKEKKDARRSEDVDAGAVDDGNSKSGENPAHDSSQEADRDEYDIAGKTLDDQSAKPRPALDSRNSSDLNMPGGFPQTPDPGVSKTLE